jgi:hypothetical protein
VKTIRTECLDQLVIFGERHLRHLVREFLIHYLTERYHQGIGGRIIVRQCRRATTTLRSVRSNAGLVSAERSTTTPVRLHEPPGGFSDGTR